MKPDASSERGVQLEEFQCKHRTGLVTLVFTDLVDSVALRRRRIVTTSADATAKVWLAASVEQVAQWQKEEQMAAK